MAARPKRTRQRAAAKAIPKARPALSPERRAEVERKLGYTFVDETLLNRALTHPSLIDNFDGDAQFSNQRLEFLGDRVLGLVMAELLIARFPNEREGFMTKVFHTLVSGETCAAVGEGIDLRPFIFMDASMAHNRGGGYDRSVADAVEALIAAIYRDGGYGPAKDFIKKTWVFDAISSATAPVQNPKTRLSEWCGKNRVSHAVYETVERSGPDHAPVFRVRVSVDGKGQAVETGASKQEAEMAAAETLLRELESQ